MSRITHFPNTAAAARTRTHRRHSGGGTLIGVFIGLVLGLGLAAGVAYYLMKANGPFPAQGGTKEARTAPRETAKTARADKSDSSAEKPRFDFYKILPGVDEPKTGADARKSADRAVVDQAKTGESEKTPERPRDKAVAMVPDREAAATTTPATKLPERFWLQAGSFASESDAENLKARLAFAGWQASVQQGTVPDKGIRFRVRLGPYDNTDELNRMRNDLTKNGFDVAVIKF